jgi:hypothetical protein
MRQNQPYNTATVSPKDNHTDNSIQCRACACHDYRPYSRVRGSANQLPRHHRLHNRPLNLLPDANVSNLELGIRSILIHLALGSASTVGIDDLNTLAYPSRVSSLP